MTSKSPVADRVSRVIHRLEERAGDLPERVVDAQDALARWGTRARRFARDNPGTVLVGAVAIGFLLARAARHA
jgi:hypothetical protein